MKAYLDHILGVNPNSSFLDTVNQKGKLIVLPGTKTHAPRYTFYTKGQLDAKRRCVEVMKRLDRAGVDYISVSPHLIWYGESKGSWKVEVFLQVH